MSESFKIRKIIKRDGTEVDFDSSKIFNAISKANNTVEELNKLSNDKIYQITSKVKDKIFSSLYTMPVEDIQELVEKEIMKAGAYEVAQKYIRYRYQRSLNRKENNTDKRILSLLNLENEDIKQENSNKNPVIVSTQRDYMAGEVSKDISRRYLIPEDVMEMHDKGIGHFHDLDYFAQNLHNCFHSKEKLITDKGVKSFSELKDGETIFVVDLNGIWQQAIVHYYGKQVMNKITLQSTRSIKEVIATPNHTWILADGSRTTNLQIGDLLWNLPSNQSLDVELDTLDKKRAFILGMIIGDGSDCINTKGIHTGNCIRLCGNKIKYANIFSECGYKTTPIKNSEDIKMHYYGYNTPSKQEFLTHSMWRYMSREQKIALFLGYYAADGTTQANGIATTDSRIVEMIKEISALAGYYITKINHYTHDTNFKLNAEIYDIGFRKIQHENNRWMVKDIKRYHSDTLYDCWCVEQPVNHSFTLDNGVVTGNCDLINLEDMLQNGTVISGTKIDKPHSFYTAANITTQIVAQVASSQYGLK